MKSNYKRLGDYIVEQDARNSNNEELELWGVSINKIFIKSVANIIGTDLSRYKIIDKNYFVCSLMQVSRDEKIPIALWDKNRAIVSPAYKVFKVKDEKVLLPEYLSMWFKRSEFDREASYYGVGGVRGSLEWEDFCDMRLPIPDITKQQEIVNAYNTIENRIALKQQINANLEEQILQKNEHFFNDYNEACVDIKLNDVADFVNGYSYSSDELQKSNTAMATIKNFDKLSGLNLRGYKEIIPIKKIKKEQYLNDGDIIVAHTDLTPEGVIIGNVEQIIDVNVYEKVILSMDLVKVIPKEDKLSNAWIYFILHSKNFKIYSKQYINGTTVMHLSKEALKNYRFKYPKDNIFINRIENFINNIFNCKRNIIKEIKILEEVESLLLSKLAN